MKKLLLGAAFCATISLATTSVQAGARTYISRTGSDTNNTCINPSAPWATFQRGVNQAGVAGEVYCLDSGFFGFMNITSSISIMCEDHHGQVGVNAISINAGANDVVVINGIDMDHRDVPLAAGINFTGAGTLILRNSSIRHAQNGILFAPAGSAKLVIDNTNFEGQTNAGVLIEPAASGTFQVNLDGVKSTNNLVGVSVAAGAGETINLEIHNSQLQQNSDFGLLSSTVGNGANNANIDNSSVSNNVRGVQSVGAKSIVRINSSVFSRNNIGFVAASGGSILSYGNNAVNSVSAIGGPTGTVGLQ